MDSKEMMKEVDKIEMKPIKHEISKAPTYVTDLNQSSIHDSTRKNIVQCSFFDFPNIT